MSDVKEWYVYTLSDPRTNEVRYVGWTVNTAQRLREHISKSKNEKSHKARWVNQLTSLDIRPIIAVIESGTGDGWQDAECRWIAYHRSIGTRLTNNTNGGQGNTGYKHTPEAIEKMASSKRGRKQSSEIVAARVKANTGKKRTPEFVARIVKMNTGKKRTPDQIEKMRHAKLGKVSTDEQLSGFRANRTVVRRSEDGLTFKSVTDAAREMRVVRQAISNAITKGSLCAGYHWERVENE